MEIGSDESGVLNNPKESPENDERNRGKDKLPVYRKAGTVKPTVDKKYRRNENDGIRQGIYNSIGLPVPDGIDVIRGDEFANHNVIPDLNTGYGGWYSF
jgi:hypothetical protein